MTNEGPRHEWVDRLSSLKQYQHNGKRAPHKPLLVLMAVFLVSTSFAIQPLHPSLVRSTPGIVSSMVLFEAR
jgi:hypothetical protein